MIRNEIELLNVLSFSLQIFKFQCNKITQLNLILFYFIMIKD